MGATTAPTQHRAVLDAFEAAIRREAHNLQAHPDLLWQQLYNRLQWEAEPVLGVLEPDFKRRSAPGSPPWLRTRVRVRESGALRRTLAGHRDAVTCCAFTPDGRRFVSGGNDGTVRVWDPADGRQISVLRGHDGRVSDCAVMADSTIAVTTGFDGTLRAWRIDTGAALGVLLATGGPLLACAAGPGGGEVLAGGIAGSLHAVSVPWENRAAGVGTCRSSLERGPGISAVAVSPDGTGVACGHGDGSVSSWDLHSLSPRQTGVLGVHPDVVFTACFTPDGATLVTGDGVGVVRLWDWAARSLVREVLAHRGVVNQCVAFPSGGVFASVGDDTNVRLASVRADHPATVLTGHFRPATCCAVSPSAELLATGSDDGTIRLWEPGVVSGEHADRAAGHDRWVVASSFSADGSRLLTGSRDGDMIVWDSATGEILGSLGPEPGLEWCAMSPDGRSVISVGDGTTLWDVSSGCGEAALAWKPPVRWCGFSPDGEVLAGLDAQGKRMWDLTEPDPPFVTRTHRMASSIDKSRRTAGPDFDFTPVRCAFAPFGSEIATPGPNGTVLVWEIDADRPRVLGRHDGQVATCAWDPGGRVVASAGQDRVVRLWNVRDRTPSGTLQGHAGWVNDLAFLDQGLLASASSDGTIRLWDTDAGKQLCCYPAPGNVFLSCAAHPGRGWLCATDIAGEVVWLTLEFVRLVQRSS